MLGIRGSMELIGGASCSLLVGQLLKIHWTFAFLIYGFGFVILIMYLLFVPTMEQVEKKQITKRKQVLNKKDLGMILGMALLAGFVICINLRLVCECLCFKLLVRLLRVVNQP